MGKYAPIWISNAQQEDESDIINQLSPSQQQPANKSE